MKIRLNPDEVCLNQEQMNDINHMYDNVPSIRIAREAFLSMILSSPFTFSIPQLGLSSNEDMEKVITRYWMPWQRSVYDCIKKYGVAPYYFIKPEGQSQHQVPIVPSFDMGYITIETTEKHKLKFRWYWNHGKIINLEEKAMLWIVTEHAPNPDGTLKSGLSSLLSQYRTILVLQKSLEIVATQNANPTHVLEFHPGSFTAKNDNLTQLRANFGEKAAGLSKERQDLSKATEMRALTSELIKQTHNVHQMNMYNGQSNRKRVLWTDMQEDVLDRMDSGFSNRVVPLTEHFKYVQAARPTIVAELDKHMTSFNLIASGIMDFAFQLIQPSGFARSQNLKGSERFENERIREMLQFFTQITQTALIIAYRPQFEQGFNEAKLWVANRRGGDPYRIANLCPELDVLVDMSCTPMINYQDLKEMWTDGIISKKSFAHHAFHMRSLPHDQIQITNWPDMIPKELLSKMNSQKSTIEQVPPKKQKKQRSEEQSAGTD